jgi:predicted O-methyltransferase YrrM
MRSQDLRGRAGRRLRLWRDLARLERARPPLAPADDAWQELLAELASPHERYVAEVSDPVWAASLEASAFLLHLCRACRPRSVLELGSGFTSYVLRRHAAEAGGQVSVLSLDHDPEWLAKTAAFLGAYDLPADGLSPLRSLRADERFDLVFNDLFGPLRDDATREALRRLAPGGIFVVDDADRPEHRSALFAAGRGLRFHNVRRWTLDERGRWSLVATGTARPESPALS